MWGTGDTHKAATSLWDSCDRAQQTTASATRASGWPGRPGTLEPGWTEAKPAQKRVPKTQGSSGGDKDGAGALLAHAQCLVQGPDCKQVSTPKCLSPQMQVPHGDSKDRGYDAKLGGWPRVSEASLVGMALRAGASPCLGRGGRGAPGQACAQVWGGVRPGPEDGEPLPPHVTPDSSHCLAQPRTLICRRSCGGQENAAPDHTGSGNPDSRLL